MRCCKVSPRLGSSLFAWPRKTPTGYHQLRTAVCCQLRTWKIRKKKLFSLLNLPKNILQKRLQALGLLGFIDPALPGLACWPPNRWRMSSRPKHVCLSKHQPKKKRNSCLSWCHFGPWVRDASNSQDQSISLNKIRADTSSLASRRGGRPYPFRCGVPTSCGVFALGVSGAVNGVGGALVPHHDHSTQRSH